MEPFEEWLFWQKTFFFLSPFCSVVQISNRKRFLHNPHPLRSVISFHCSQTCIQPWACRPPARWWTPTLASTLLCSTSRTTCVSGGQRSRRRSTASPSGSVRASGSPWSRSKLSMRGCLTSLFLSGLFHCCCALWGWYFWKLYICTTSADIVCYDCTLARHFISRNVLRTSGSIIQRSLLSVTKMFFGTITEVKYKASTLYSYLIMLMATNMYCLKVIHSLNKLNKRPL